MVPVTFLLHPEHLKQVQGLEEVAEFTLHIPPLIWEWTTYFHLKNAGYDVRLTDKMPEEGIVQVSACNYGLMEKPPANVLLIDTLADSPPRFYAHVHVSQNPWQHKDFRTPFSFPVWRFINIWPQPGIVPRDAARGRKFERIGFFGHYDQLEPGLQSDRFKEELAKRGLSFHVIDRDFTDYTNIDAVIAVRSFPGEPQLHKPSSKLINGWMGGVPVLVTNESAFMDMQRSPLDFIEINSLDSLLAGLDKLQASPDLVERMVANGRERIKDYTHEKVVGMWGKLLFNEAQDFYEDWRRKSRLQKQAVYTEMFLSRSVRSATKKIKKRLAIS